jgi:hypothetical protein
MDPVKSLLCNKNSFSFSNFPEGTSGIVPFNLLPSKYKSLMFGGIEKIVGIVPVSEQFEMYKFTKEGNSNNVEGNGPPRNWLLEKSTNVSTPSGLKISGANVPLKKLLFSNKFS